MFGQRQTVSIVNEYEWVLPSGQELRLGEGASAALAAALGDLYYEGGPLTVTELDVRVSVVNGHLSRVVRVNGDVVRETLPGWLEELLLSLPAGDVALGREGAGGPLPGPPAARFRAYVSAEGSLSWLWACPWCLKGTDDPELLTCRRCGWVFRSPATVEVARAQLADLLSRAREFAAQPKGRVLDVPQDGPAWAMPAHIRAAATS